MWLGPLVAAAATALALVLFMLPVLPRIVPADPVQQVVRAVVNEHSRALMWGARQPQILPAGLPWLTQETGIDLRQAFAGDDRLSLVSAEPVYLTRQRGLAVHYRDVDGHLVSYIVLPAERSFTMVERPRGDRSLPSDARARQRVRDVDLEAGRRRVLPRLGHGLAG